ncbi:aldolase/citrate lyase family protein [Neogemmobacter tilapiae]|uniref:Hydroxypyruvate/pyruvate aldolase n=1 Tax=Neogemmobacter tilapiae TaxID=875041 RepID=A0A918WI04_9RHOB|nr:aldolase/citrate lyase family protein [Gemmobacter tilapiae]GHC49411.1 2,4-dihydroxyhept-2-ene-1,7-dioic acid aldolase [Gemmobacter tilapiae]
MTLPLNHFKRALKEGRQQIGLWNTIAGPVVAEALAGTGFDWLLIDTEHSLTDVPDVLGMLQAVSAYPISPVVRPAANDPVLFKRLLDFGAQTLLVPYVQTAKEAQAAVAAMRYPPRGIRGAGGTIRANRFGTVDDYMNRAEQELCLLVQVETAATLDQIEAIAAVDGVDGLFIGPNDLAATMGYTGNPGHPVVKTAILDAIGRIAATGKAAGILTLDRDFAQECMEKGSTFTAVGVDLVTLLGGVRALARDFGRG